MPLAEIQLTRYRYCGIDESDWRLTLQAQDFGIQIIIYQINIVSTNPHLVKSFTLR